MDQDVFGNLAKLFAYLAGGLIGIFLLTHGARWFVAWRASGRE